MFESMIFLFPRVGDGGGTPSDAFTSDLPKATIQEAESERQNQRKEFEVETKTENGGIHEVVLGLL